VHPQQKLSYLPPGSPPDIFLTPAFVLSSATVLPLWYGNVSPVTADLLTKEGQMNRDQFKGAWTQFKGELKKQWGKLTDDDLMKIEGDYDKYMGTIQQRYGDSKEEVTKWSDKWFTDYEAKRGPGKV
jgi:uncharacterized protein YjbJ (UPF0337 family)